MIRRYRKKPVADNGILCVQWKCDEKENNFSEVQELNHGSRRCLAVDDNCVLHIRTLFVEELALPGDYIVPNEWGELHVCSKDHFEKNYELLTEDKDIKNE